MSLMLPRSQGGLIQHNLAATPSNVGNGTSVPAHATINTKSAWVQIFAATNFDVHGISLAIQNDAVSSAQIANLYDIGVGAAASEQPIISNLLNTGGTSTPTSGMKTYFFPLFIPKGTRISARHQSNVTIQPGVVTMFLHGGFDIPPWKSFQGADGIGIDTADSGGTTHTPGSSGTESTWANIGSTLARDYSAIMPIVSTGTDTTMTSLSGHVEIGINSTTLMEYYFATNNTEFVAAIFPTVPAYGFYPAGTQMMIRAEMSGTADTDLEFALLGFY